MKRNKFNLSNYKLLSCDMGDLVPVGLTEVLPGDTVQHATSALVRVSPLLAPVMHPVHVRIHHWFVPHRLVWDDFEKFITGGPDGMDESVFPTRTIDAAPGTGTLADYLGVPPTAGDLPVSALPFRGYSLIFNEWYRDQDLQTPLVVSKASGADVTTNIGLQRICWEKDYFTSSREWTQKGPEVTIPLGTTAPIIGTGGAYNVGPLEVGVRTAAGGGGSDAQLSSDGGTPSVVHEDLFLSPASLFFRTAQGTIDYSDFAANLTADLAGASAADINALREAFAIQRYQEARARYGSRYTEYLRYLGVRSSDARLQRPEYLGGGKQTIQFSEVLQTGVTTDGDDTEGVGNLKGHGIAALRSNRYRRFFEEHGYIFTLMSVRPKTMYVQGLPRTWNRRTKEDFYQRELEHIGQQEVLQKEVYANGDPVNDEDVFGYQDRYDEYRRTESTVAGDFRTTLDFWHMGRIFEDPPALNSDFVECLPTKRINAVQSEDVLWVMVNHDMQARRMLSQKGNSFIY